MNDNKMEVLQGIYEYICKVDENILAVTDQLRQSMGLENVSDIIEGMTYIIRVFDATNDLHDIKADAAAFKNITSDVLEGMENGDFGLIADIFEYEFKPLFEEWREKLDMVIAR